MTEPTPQELERSLDDALGRALCGPQVPPTLRARVNAALSRAAETDLAGTRERLEREQRERLRALEAEYVRIRRGTLVTLLATAFTVGAAAVLAMPWLRAHLGEYTPLAITWGGVALGMGITFQEPLRRVLRSWSDAL